MSTEKKPSNTIYACSRDLQIVPGAHIDPILGTCRLLQSIKGDRVEYLEKSMVSHNSIETSHIKDLIESRKCMGNPHVWYPEEYKISSESRCCGSVSKIVAYFPTFDNSLQKMIGLQGTPNQGFDDKFLMRLVKNTLSGMRSIEVTNSYHGHLAPKYIGFLQGNGQNSQFIVAEDFADKNSHVDMPLSGRSKNDLYMSPEGFKLLCDGKPYTSPGHDLVISDVFTLGMILLKCATACSTHFCYDIRNNFFDKNLLNSYLVALSGSRKQSIPVFVQIVKEMLAFKPEDRPNFAKLMKMLDSGHSEVRNPYGIESNLWTQITVNRTGKDGSSDQSTATGNKYKSTVYKEYIKPLDLSQVSENQYSNTDREPLVAKSQIKQYEAPIPHFPVNLTKVPITPRNDEPLASYLQSRNLLTLYSNYRRPSIPNHIPSNMQPQQTLNPQNRNMNPTQSQPRLGLEYPNLQNPYLIKNDSTQKVNPYPHEIQPNPRPSFLPQPRPQSYRSPSQPIFKPQPMFPVPSAGNRQQSTRQPNYNPLMTRIGLLPLNSNK